MIAKYAVRNGELIAAQDANISVFNKSLFFDFAVYSNIKVVQGKMFLPEFEIERLFNSAKTLGIEHPFIKDEVIRWAKMLIDSDNLKDALIRLLLIGPQKDSEALLFLFPVGLTFYSNDYYTNGAKLVTYNGERMFPTVKSKDLLLGYIAYGEAAKKDAIDALLIDTDGNIREGTRSSFFAIKDGTLIAPPQDKVLEGVTRKIILEIAKTMMIVVEEDIPLLDIGSYDECFITGTTLNVMPVRQIDGIELKKEWKYIKILQERFKEYCRELMM